MTPRPFAGALFLQSTFMTSDLVLEPWQFNLSKTPAPDAIAVGGFHLRCGPDIHAVRLHDSAGVFVGVVFGFPIDLPGKKVLTSSAGKI